jgi:hypothetical protein
MPRIARILSTGSIIAPAMQAARCLLSTVLIAAVLAASLHHLACLTDDVAGGTTVAFVASSEPQAPLSGEPCLPGHCHCVCHVAQPMLATSSFLVVFTEPAYNFSQNDPLPSVRGYPPFKPPRA